MPTSRFAIVLQCRCGYGSSQAMWDIAVHIVSVTEHSVDACGERSCTIELITTNQTEKSRRITRIPERGCPVGDHSLLRSGANSARARLSCMIADKHTYPQNWNSRREGLWRLSAECRDGLLRVPMRLTCRFRNAVASGAQHPVDGFA